MSESIPDGITRKHVLAALAAIDRGEEHAFAPSVKYDLIHNDRRYAPKAVLGIAAEGAIGRKLGPYDFKGGEGSKCFRVLRELGFDIVPKAGGQRDDPVQRDVVAWVLQANPKVYDIDTYFSRRTDVYWNCPRFGDRMRLGMPVFFKRSGPGGGIIACGSITELPKLRDEVSHPELLGSELWSEPRVDDVPKVGIRLDDVRLSLSEGMLATKDLESIPELAGHPLVTVRQGTVFRLSEHQANGVLRCWGVSVLVIESNPAAETEGRRKLVRHYRIERSRKLRDDKRKEFVHQHGKLYCEVCRRDYLDTYPGDDCSRLFEVHHTKPLGDLDGPVVTTLDDLVVVCSNCHKMIHHSADAEVNLQRLCDWFDRPA